MIYLTPQVYLFLPVYLQTNVELPGLPAAALQSVLSAPGAHLAPPTSLEYCFFFNSLLLDFHTVRFPGSSGCLLFLN